MSRLISLNVHTAIEILIASAVMAAPFVFGFGPAGLVTAFVIGALLMGLALSSTGTDRGSLSVGAHAAYDLGIALGLVLAALALGIAGDPIALVVLAVAGVTQVALSANTRYSSPARA